MNLALVITPLMVAFIYTETRSYSVTFLLFIFISLASLVLSIIIYFEDIKINRVLNSAITEEETKCLDIEANNDQEQDEKKKLLE
jgi:nitrate/nitrite transporter NarK